MKLLCPLCHKSKIYLNGSFRRLSDSKTIQRYKCGDCGKRFSRATFNLCYRQRKRKVNHLLRDLLCSAVSQRRCALVLNLTRNTVVRKFKFLAKVARMQQRQLLKNITNISMIQIDDLITSEHTKCKPLSVSVAIERDSRLILGAVVSSMPAFGHLAAISRKKYGERMDERKAGLDTLFQTIEKTLDREVKVISDDHRFYPEIIARYRPEANHQTHLSSRASLAGQGELKKLRRDPLFMINHTLAMMRANMNRLIRKTWCTTKKASFLQDHLDLYLHFHNTELIKGV